MKIDGRSIAQEIYHDLDIVVKDFLKKGIKPHLAVILVGDDPASKAYVSQKRKHGESVGMAVTIYTYSSETTVEILTEKIKQLNDDTNIHGIIIQQPLPKHINPQTLIDATDPAKDVDGFCTDTAFTPPIALAVIKMLEYVYHQTFEKDAHYIFQDTHAIETWLRTQKIAVIGKGETGGAPIIKKLEKEGMSVMVVDSKTQNAIEKLQKADIIISCVGKKGVLQQAVKKSAIVLGIGMYRGEDGKLHGDYEESEISGIAGWYSPIPGGVGPVNVAMLLANVLLAVTAQNGEKEY